MNLVNNYKNEICSMSLSADFKETLKQRCREELESNGAQGAGNAAEVSSRVKFYKYVSIAACLVAAVSTIGVVSLMSGNIKYRSSDSDNRLGGDNAMYSEDAMQEDVTSGSDSDGENEVNANFMPENSADTTGDEADSIIAPEEIPESEAEDDFWSSPDMVADVPPESMLSSYVGYNYDGDYYTEDYVLMLSGSDVSIEANVYSDYDEFASNAAAAPDAVTRNAPSSALNFYDLLDTKFADEAQRGGVSLVKMTVQGILDDDTLPALEDGMYTLYDVNIEYDYLNTQACDVDAYVWIKGTAENQLEGMPVYDVGDTILTSLYVTESGSVTVIDELLYDVYTLNDLDIAYHRGYEDINPGYTDMGILDNEREFITTTTNNPVVYTHKASVKELSRYIRRKINEKELNYADLETLAAISRGEAVPAISDGSDDDTTFDDGTDVGDNIEPVTSLSLNVSDSDIALSYSGQNIILDDSSSASSMESALKSSATGTISSGTELNMMFVGGKMTIKTDDQGSKRISSIEITSAGCPLDISFNGVKVGDSLESVVSALGITENMAPDCTVVFSSNSVDVTLSFEYGVLSGMTIK